MEIMRAPFLLILLASFGTAAAQFDYGMAAGGVLSRMWAFESDDPHASGWVRDVGRSSISASAFYRERYSSFVDLGLDLTLVHHSFSAGQAYHGLGGGHSRSARAEIDLLYIGLKPEVRMDAKRLAVVRFGLAAGVPVGGSAKGTASTWTVTGQSTRQEGADLTRYFGGDLRFAFGFGFRVPAGEHWAITIDTEATLGLTSMMSGEVPVRGSDIGLRIGLSRRSTWKALTSLFNPDYAVGFVARVESAMAARVSLRKNSPSYSDERKPSEALGAAVISGRSRSPTAYSGFKAPPQDPDAGPVW